MHVKSKRSFNLLKLVFFQAILMMISNLRHQKSVKKVKKCKKVKVKAFFFWSVVKQAKIAFLTWPTVSKVAFVIGWPWTVIWRVPSSFFGNISSAIFLSENAFLRNIRKQTTKRREEELGRFGCVGIASHSQGTLPNFQRMVSDDRKTPAIRTGNSARHTKEGKLSGLLSFFEESNLECWEKRKVNWRSRQTIAGRRRTLLLNVKPASILCESNKIASRCRAPRPPMTDVGTETAFRLD